MLGLIKFQTNTRLAGLRSRPVQGAFSAWSMLGSARKNSSNTGSKPQQAAAAAADDSRESGGLLSPDSVPTSALPNSSLKAYDGIRAAISASLSSSRTQVPPHLSPKLDLTSQVYEAHQFSLGNILRRRRPEVPEDKFKNTSLDPLQLWKDPTALSQYINSNGKILPAYQTGNSRKTQLLIAKAVRRARAAGLLSPVHKSVELM